VQRHLVTIRKRFVVRISERKATYGLINRTGEPNLQNGTEERAGRTGRIWLLRSLVSMDSARERILFLSMALICYFMLTEAVLTTTTQECSAEGREKNRS
jgi:hypothetical protein